MDIDFSIITWDVFKIMLRAFQTSLGLAVVILIAGTILGIIGAAMKLSRNKIVRAIAICYVEIFRGTPMMVQISIAYLAIPALVHAITKQYVRFDPLITGAVAMSLNSGAYSTETIRAGIISIDKGQWEAADTLGLSYRQKMTMIILPQAFKRLVPMMVNEFITLIKDTSLLSTIGVVELMKSSTTIGANYYSYLPPLFTASAIYLVTTLIISNLSKSLERRLAESD